jgi:ribosome-associated protein
MNAIDISQEVQYRTSRSGGSGGQHVNKTETKVEALFHIQHSGLFTDEQKQLLLERLSHRVNKEGYVSVYNQTSRSQLQNKELALQGMQILITKALEKRKERVPTKMSKAIKENILKNKKFKSQLKEGRKKIKDY